MSQISLLVCDVRSTGISEAGPYTANAPPQSSTFFTFVKKKISSISFKHFVFYSLSKQISR